MVADSFLRQAGATRTIGAAVSIASFANFITNRNPAGSRNIGTHLRIESAGDGERFNRWRPKAAGNVCAIVRADVYVLARTKGLAP
jgi:hypothetical protein